jgi:RNA polymerase sigma-70 factor, ECF subfamily
VKRPMRSSKLAAFAMTRSQGPQRIERGRRNMKLLACKVETGIARCAVDVEMCGMSDFGHELVALLPRLRRFARSLTGQPEDTDDLVQASLERALRSRSLWEPGTRLDAWIFTIMRNLWIDQIRHRKVSGDRITVHDAEQLSGSDGRVVADCRITLADVVALIAALPGEQRAVVQSVCIDDLSYRETAERLKTPIGTVMSRLARARLALAAALDHNQAAAGVVSMTKSR